LVPIITNHDRFYKLGTADEAVGLESSVEPWVEGLYLALATVCFLSIPVQQVEWVGVVDSWRMHGMEGEMPSICWFFFQVA